MKWMTGMRAISDGGVSFWVLDMDDIAGVIGAHGFHVKAESCKPDMSHPLTALAVNHAADMEAAWREAATVPADTYAKAMDDKDAEIERLRAEIEALRAKINPFMGGA